MRYKRLPAVLLQAVPNSTSLVGDGKQRCELESEAGVRRFENRGTQSHLPSRSVHRETLRSLPQNVSESPNMILIRRKFTGGHHTFKFFGRNYRAITYHRLAQDPTSVLAILSIGGRWPVLRPRQSDQHHARAGLGDPTGSLHHGLAPTTPLVVAHQVLTPGRWKWAVVRQRCPIASH